MLVGFVMFWLRDSGLAGLRTGRSVLGGLFINPYKRQTGKLADPIDNTTFFLDRVTVPYRSIHEIYAAERRHSNGPG